MSNAPNLTSLSGVRRILRERDLKPLKTLGQNFLVDLNILNMIVRAADLRPGDAVLEIGAGLGVLTEALAAGGRRVVAVEKDLRLREHLESRFAGAAFTLPRWRLTTGSRGNKRISSIRRRTLAKTGYG